MKSTLLSIALMLFISFAHSQQSFGIKAGPSFFKLHGENYDDDGFKTKTAFHAGIYYRVPFNQTFRFQAELLYSAEGVKFENEDLKANIKMNYLNVPLMLQITTRSGFYGETGAQIGFLMSAKAEYEEDGEKQTEEGKDFSKGTAFSWGFGVGYMKDKFGIGARYNLGLSTIPKDSEDGDDKSSGFQISLLFRIK